MSVGGAVFGILSTNAGVTALVATRIYPVTIPQTAALPVIAYHVIADAPDNVMDGPAPVDHELIQIDVWAMDYGTASAIREAVRVAFEDQDVLIARGIGAKVTAFYPDAYEPDTKRYSRSIGVSFWTPR